MRNLYLRIFLTFWTAMVLVLAFTVVATLTLASERTQREQERQQRLAHEASSVLARDGIPGLRNWLEQQSSAVLPSRLFVLDKRGDDLLGRHVPDFLQARVGHQPFSEAAAADRMGRDAQLLSQLVSPTDETYALSLLRQGGPGPFGIFNSIETPVVTSIITLVVSTCVCFLLARYLSDPIRHLRAATRSIADGDLRVRVAGLLGRRRDELALLAADFDVMTERVRALLESQQHLLRDVSHELRSPLARLQIALGLARRPGADLEQEFDRIEQETQRLDELIGEILSLSRLDDAAHVVTAEWVSLQELLETLADNARLEAERRWVRVDLQVAEGLHVEGDRELLYRALENVVRNAVHFSPDGSSIELSAVQSGDRALVHVVDHGPGVPAELFDRIFEPFFRVANARDHNSGGYGIGLAITARVVRLHGGGVKATDTPGGGLKVEIRLPLRQPSPKVPSLRRAPAPLAATQSA